MSSRYSGLGTSRKQAVSIAQGFFVASLRVPTMRSFSRATNTREVLSAWSTPRSVVQDDQWPRPKSFVRRPAAADRSEAIAAASASEAGENESRT